MGDDVEAVEAEHGGYAAAVRMGEYDVSSRKDFKGQDGRME